MSDARNDSLTQRKILLSWLPLAASWLLMAAEIPYVNATLARLSEAERMIASFGLVASLSITIESPVISLLATSTALARSPQNYRMLRRFTQHLMLGTTILHLLLGWTPLFDLVVVDWLGAPESLHAPTQLGLRIMVLWSAAIAWRRFKQGVMIRYGQSRYVGQGTLVRLLSSAGTATVLALFTPASGVAVGAFALSAGVLAEAAYAQRVARGLVAEQFEEMGAISERPDISYRQLVNFHWPLAASNLLFLLTQPIVAAGLARSPRPELALAAWPVLNGLFFLTRAPSVALPEVVIALGEEESGRPALKRFGLRVGVITTLILGVVSFTPLASLYFRGLIGVSAELSQIATLGAMFGLLIPMAMSLVSVYRGLLTAQQITRPMALAMALDLLILSGTLAIGISIGLRGVPVAAIAVTLGLASEALILSLASQRSSRERLPGRIRAWFLKS